MKIDDQYILYIDDDEPIRNLVRNEIDSLPFKNFLFPKTPKECQKMISNYNIYAAIIDYNLINWLNPDIDHAFELCDKKLYNGIELAQYLNEQRPAINIGLYSSYEAELKQKLDQNLPSANLKLLTMRNASPANLFGFVADYLNDIFIHPIDVNKILLPDVPKIGIISSWDMLINNIAQDDGLLYDLNWQKFEDLIGHLLEKSGWQIHPMGRTKDGGVDLIASQTINPGIPFEMMVQCKKYSKNNKVGIEILKEVWATKWEKGFHQAMIVTTSFFTKGANNKAEQWRLELRDHYSIFDWCKQSKK